MNGLRLRSSQGCWTCRLRRKKCDEAHPTCAACLSLEIDCHYSDTKPEWMDGGAREKQMADELKIMVKQKANERRERKWGQLPTLMDLSPSAQAQQQRDREQREQEHDHEQQSSDRVMSDAGDPTPSDHMSSEETPPSTAPSETSPQQQQQQQEQIAQSRRRSTSPPASWKRQIQPATDAFPENKSELEVNYTMMYLDYVVPFLFPFYRPCLLESSRGWMLVLLMKNRALFHTALSLSNWLFGVVLQSVTSDGGGINGTGEDDHNECRRANWAQLQAQQTTAISVLQQDISALNERGVANAFRECVACIQSIVQLLEFEVATASIANWQVHHDAAVALFDQLITHHATVTAPPDLGDQVDNIDDGATDAATTATGPWWSIMDRLGDESHHIILPNGRQILTSDQSAYQFYTAYLLWIDVLAATTNGDEPRLQRYHSELLAGPAPRIALGEYVGCHSWAVLEIAAAARVAAWKRAQQASGSLSIVDLARRACAVETRLQQRLASLACLSTCREGTVDAYDPSAIYPVTPYLGFHEAVGASSGGGRQPRSAGAMDLHTRIWAQAAVTYVHVVASGLQPALPEIRSSVAATIELLRTLPSPLALRTLVWPFAVTGCLALREQEGFFVDLVEGMGAMHVFGTVGEALNIMRRVWEHRDSGCIEPQMWDIATCFSLLGHRSLLV
ncbi:fungal-specific transcription factor domain-containing protein [Nemania sp. FL0916]|nr:fungal-specific transcription factor domain-containing protein [Nemania sp. FL0916]